MKKILLSDGYNFALVDDDIYRKLNKYKWVSNGSSAIRKNINGDTITMARNVCFIKTGNWPQHRITHLDKDLLNNQWQNLDYVGYKHGSIHHIYRTNLTVNCKYSDRER